MNALGDVIAADAGHGFVIRHRGRAHVVDDDFLPDANRVWFESWLNCTPTSWRDRSSDYVLESGGVAVRCLKRFDTICSAMALL